MKIEIWTLGKTIDAFIVEGEKKYLKRLKHYVPTEIRSIAGPKARARMSPAKMMEEEAAIMISHLKDRNALVIALDENGIEYDSRAFAGYLEKQFLQSQKQIIFLIGGPYGFSDDLLSRVDGTLSLSKMTFTHQMVRLFLLEQLYRAMTIIRNEAYHH